MLRQHRLEPGIRECVAVVIMPSFVPSMHMESSGNWFKLTNPKHKEFQLVDAMKMSKLVKGVQTCNGKINDADCYRDGDLTRLMAKAKQLEARLPLQDVKVQVPNENTLGGFEIIYGEEFALSSSGAYSAGDTKTDALRLRALPLNGVVTDFVKAHKKTYVIELNTDAQVCQLVRLHVPEDAMKILPLNDNDGLPLTAKWIVDNLK